MGAYAQRVLVVDDNENIRSGLRHFLESAAQLEVCGEAADGMEAIHEALKQNPTLILMDLSMPNMNGIEAAAAIKRLLPDARIVVFTLFSDSLAQSIAKLSGVDLIISKTEGTTGLLNALRPFLADSASQPPTTLH